MYTQLFFLQEFDSIEIPSNLSWIGWLIWPLMVLVFWGIIIYLMILCIKALKKYLAS